jgi:hypothetical protein
VNLRFHTQIKHQNAKIKTTYQNPKRQEHHRSYLVKREALRQNLCVSAVQLVAESAWAEAHPTRCGENLRASA